VMIQKYDQTVLKLIVISTNNFHHLLPSLFLE
jgi:hypothetical protein